MTTVTRRWRSTLLALPLACLVTVLAACDINGSAAKGPAQPTEPEPSITALSPEPASPTEPPTAGSSAPTPRTSARCTAGKLQVGVAPGDSAPGHIGLILVFTNTSTKPCTMSGYPGVSFVTGASGSQVNDPAQRSPVEGSPATVTLAANGKAHANLLLVNVATYAGSNVCRPTDVAGVRVYPPDDTTALFASSPQQVCSVKGTGVAQIYPVQTGAGDS